MAEAGVFVSASVISRPHPDVYRNDERALFAIVPHTTALRGGQFEAAVNVP
jgi:hypothetical protein